MILAGTCKCTAAFWTCPDKNYSLIRFNLFSRERSDCHTVPGPRPPAGSEYCPTGTEATSLLSDAPGFISAFSVFSCFSLLTSFDSPNSALTSSNFLNILYIEEAKASLGEPFFGMALVLIGVLPPIFSDKPHVNTNGYLLRPSPQ